MRYLINQDVVFINDNFKDELESIIGRRVKLKKEGLGKIFNSVLPIVVSKLVSTLFSKVYFKSGLHD